VNDYLNNLAARSLNLTPALQPRFRSRFEPAPPGDAQSPATATDGSDLDVETAEIESAQPVAARRVSGRRAIAQAEPIAPPRETSAPRLSGKTEAFPDADSIEGTLSQQPPAISQPEPISQFRPTSHAIADRAVTFDQSIPKAIESEKTKTAVQSSSRMNDGESLRSPQERLPQDVIREQVVIKEVLFKEVLQRSGPERLGAVPPVSKMDFAPERPATSSRIVAQPRIRPLPEDRSDGKIGLDDEKAAMPAPTIHVTIGRVEVRATQSSSTAPSKSSPSRPAMSLDDYLRGRGNGGAR
jgi:hypothetical protein